MMTGDSIMTFLEQIDKKYDEKRQFYAVPISNKRFICEIPIVISCGALSYSFLIQKSERAKLLFVSGKQKVYLSDAQVINTILKMSSSDSEWFLNQFILLYRGKGTQYNLELCGENYASFGIKPYPEKKDLYLMSDTLIDYICFSFALSFIFIKDACWEVLAKKDRFGKQTLCKYIALIDYYKNNSERSKVFLNQIDYPLAGKMASEETPKQRKVFKEENTVKTFDISKYLVYYYSKEL